MKNLLSFYQNAMKVKIINININKQKDITIKEILGIVDKSNLTSKLYYY